MNTCVHLFNLDMIMLESCEVVATLIYKDINKNILKVFYLSNFYSRYKLSTNNNSFKAADSV